MVFEYAPAPESTAIVDIAPSYGLFIGGEMVDPRDGALFKTVNPATEEVLSEVVAAGPEDVERALAAGAQELDAFVAGTPDAEKRILEILGRRLDGGAICCLGLHRRGAGSLVLGQAKHPLGG